MRRWICLNWIYSLDLPLALNRPVVTKPSQRAGAADSAVAMPVIVYEAPHTTRHIAERCSCAFIVSLAILVATILVPYFVAFHTSACPNRPVIF